MIDEERQNAIDAIAERDHIIEREIGGLATVLLQEFGGPTEDKSACGMATRLLREQKSILADRDREIAEKTTFINEEARKIAELKNQRDAMQRRAESAETNWQEAEKDVTEFKAERNWATQRIAELEAKIGAMNHIVQTLRLADKENDRQLATDLLNHAIGDANEFYDALASDPPKPEPTPDPIQAVKAKVKGE